MNNMTVFMSDDGKWWRMCSQHKASNYSSLIVDFGFVVDRIKKKRIKLENDERCETLTFKYLGAYYKIVNTSNKTYEEV